MSTILAIETSADLASAALLHGGKLISRDTVGVQTHSQSILPMVQALLAESGLTLAQCQAIAYGAGPGSFTGVRTACGVSQGLAYGADLPLIPVSTLMAMAQACHETDGATEVLAVLDARMEEVYWAQYRHVPGQGWHAVVPEQLSSAAAVTPAGDVVACGNGLAAYAAAFADRPALLRALPAVMPHAAQVARLAVAELAAGRTVAAADARPVYLRNKIALTTAERLAAKAAG